MREEPDTSPHMRGTKFWTFGWEYYCAPCREYEWCVLKGEVRKGPCLDGDDHRHMAGERASLQEVTTTTEGPIRCESVGAPPQSDLIH
jgi:hypothetical protein